MDGNRYNASMEADTANLSQDNTTASVISIEQLQQLVRLLDNSDVSELELRRAGEGMRLILRKVQAHEGSERVIEGPFVPSTSSASPAPEPEKTEHNILAPLVGRFHV